MNTVYNVKTLTKTYHYENNQVSKDTAIGFFSVESTWNFIDDDGVKKKVSSYDDAVKYLKGKFKVKEKNMSGQYTYVSRIVNDSLTTIKFG